MKEKLSTLNLGESILIEQSELPDFFEYLSKQKDFYSFEYTYFENIIKIRMTGKETIIKIGK